MRVQRIDEQLAASEKAPLIKVSEVSFKEIDALVVCAGFEDRSLSILRSIASPAGGRPVVLVIEYRPALLGNRLDDCLRECERLGVTTLRYVYDRESPAGAALGVWSLLSGIEGRVFLDVSGMSRLLVIQLLVGAVELRHGFERLSVLYAEAEQYHPSFEEYNTRAATAVGGAAPVQFLSWGVSQITVVPELSSVSLEDQPIHLVVFPTFDPQQLSAVRKDVEPSSMTVIHGQPLPDHGNWRMQAIQEVNKLSSMMEVSELVTSTYDYRETVVALVKVYAESGRLQRLVICPTGSKMQTVAVGVVRAFLRDIRIVYPTPRSFMTEAYTQGTKQLHGLDLDVFSKAFEAAGLAAGSVTVGNREG